MRSVLLALVAVPLLVACAEEGERAVAFAIHAPPGTGAFDGERSVAVSVLLDGVALDTATFAWPDEEPELTALPFGAEFSIAVQVFEGDLLRASGRSFPFDVDAEGASGPTDLFVGAPGEFAIREEAGPGSPVLAVAARGESAEALVARADGSVLRYRPFAPEPFEPRPSTLSTGALVVSVRGLGLVGFMPGGDTLEVHAFADDEPILVTDAAFARHGLGASLVADRQGRWLILLGGKASAVGQVSTAVTRLDITSNGPAAVHRLPNLPTGRWGAKAVAVDGLLPSAARVVTLGGESSSGATDAALVVDPSGTVPCVEVPLALSVARASVEAVDLGQLAVVGGDAIDDVRLLVVDPDGSAPISVVSPSPPPLSSARRDPVLARIAPGLVLVAGGVDAAGLPAMQAEIVDLRVFPGTVAPTGTLPEPLGAAAATMLGDGSVYLFGEARVYGYVPPVAP